MTAASAGSREEARGGPVRYAVLSDVHADLPALEAVLSDLESREPTAVYHPGDPVT